MLLQAMIIAFSMYSKIPMPKTEWNQKNMRYAICFFPVVGLVIGSIVYLIGKLGYLWQWNTVLFSSIMTVLPVILTGGIHVDGMLDTIDALSSYGDREKKLEILKDPHTGAFAIIGCVVYFMLCFGVWSEMPKEALSIIAISYAMSRTLSGFSIVTFPLAKETGLAATFQERAQKKHVKQVMILFFIIECIGMLWFQPILGLICIITAMICFGYYYHLCNKDFGGVTGDLAGYFLQICELAMLTAVMIGSNLK